MPVYNFVCDKCEAVSTEVMSISSFMKQRSNPEECCECSEGKVLVSLSPPTGGIEKRKEDIIQEIEDEVREIVKKVREGDEAAIEDVYGHRENPYKK